MPVCILGMHRSGTSMVTRMLNVCGMDLGRYEDLLQPESGILNVKKEDNPEGYWENLQFVFLNDEILRVMGGTAYTPPHLPAGWSGDTRLDDLKNRAKELIAQFGASDFWGWKDPRNTLTIEFWRSLIPDLKIILCIRNPLEVSESLIHRQQGETVQFSFNLWQSYYEQFLNTVGDTPYLVTDYATYSYNSQAELLRLLAFLNRSVADDALQKAVAAFVPGLHRKTLPATLLENLENDTKIAESYLGFTRQAGDVYQQMAADSEFQLGSLNKSAAYLFNRMKSVELQFEESQDKAKRAVQEIEKIRWQIQDYEQKLERSRSQIQDYEQKLERSRSQLKAYEEEQQRSKAKELENQIRHEEKIALLMLEHSTELEAEQNYWQLQLQQYKTQIVEQQVALVQEQNYRLSQQQQYETQIVEQRTVLAQEQDRSHQLEDQITLIAQQLNVDGKHLNDILQSLNSPNAGLTSKLIYRAIVPLNLRLFLKNLRSKSSNR